MSRVVGACFLNSSDGSLGPRDSAGAACPHEKRRKGPVGCSPGGSSGAGSARAYRGSFRGLARAAKAGGGGVGAAPRGCAIHGHGRALDAGRGGIERRQRAPISVCHGVASRAAGACTASTRSTTRAASPTPLRECRSRLQIAGWWPHGAGHGSADRRCAAPRRHG